jgi:hypothetical protein
MTDETPNGVFLRGADGSYYFIPTTDLSQYAQPDVTKEDGDEFASMAPRLDSYSVDDSNADAAIARGIGIGIGVG